MKWVSRWVLGLIGVFGTFPAQAATVQTTNFEVTARRHDVAQQVARYAEYYRRAKAIEWLGHEMPNWPDPCAVEVKITFGGAGGATSFSFENGRVLGQSMVLEGSLERIIHSVLPHEVTHTVFAAKFRRPLPRWADEGGAVLSEDQEEIARHDLLVRKIINRGGMIPLRRLFVLTEYPRDVMALYAQGFSVARYLVSLRGKQKYLEFVDHGQQLGWDYAVNRDYGFSSVDALEHQWIQWLREGRGTGADVPANTTLASNQTSVPTQPVFRSQIPDESVSAAGWGEQPSQPLSPAVNTQPLPVRRSRVVGATPSSEKPSRLPAAMSSNQRQTNPGPPRATLQPRLIPIAVGRTRRSRALPDAQAIPPANSSYFDPSDR